MRSLVLVWCAGCVVAGDTTEIQIRDPAMVSLSANGQVVLPADPAPREAPLLESAAGSAYARREDDHAISIEWHSPLPIARERVTLVSAAGTIKLQHSIDSLVTPELLAAPRLELAWCTSIVHHRSRGAGSYTVDVTGCSIPALAVVASVPYTLDVARDQVKLHERYRPRRGVAAVAMVAAGALFFGTGALVFGKSHTVADITFGLGAVFTMPWLPTLFASDRDDYR